MSEKEQVVGFLFDSRGTEVALIRKNRPEWQKGLWNGIGGHIENGESTLKAMEREFWEETGVLIENWTHKIIVHCRGYILYMFYAFSEDIHKVASLTDEIVAVHSISMDIPVIGNLRWIIPYMLDLHVVGITTVVEKPRG